MGFRKDFLWGGATAANQCEGGANEGNRGVANVDLMPLGEDRYLVGTGKMFSELFRRPLLLHRRSWFLRI